MPIDPSSAGFFEEKYKVADDPWNFAASGYELARYENIVTTLRPRRFARAFEPGCSIGVLTEHLATFCDAVESSDFSERAIHTARQRCSRFPHVEFQCVPLQEARLRGWFDLIILSEIGYYFDAVTLAAIGQKLTSHLQRGGILVGAHWLGCSVDHVLNGDEVHQVLNGLPDLKLSFDQRYPGYRLSHWSKQ